MAILFAMATFPKTLTVGQFVQRGRALALWRDMVRAIHSMIYFFPMYQSTTSNSEA